MATSDERFDQFGPNSGYIEELYRLYLDDPALVGESWAQFFSRISPATPAPAPRKNGAHAHAETPALGDGLMVLGTAPAGERAGAQPAQAAGVSGSEQVYKLVDSFRRGGHLRAAFNPLHSGIVPLPDANDIAVDSYGFTREQLSTAYACAGFQGNESMKLGDLVVELERVYCGTIGFEFMHLISNEERNWLQSRIEQRHSSSTQFSADRRLAFLRKIIEAEAFEDALHKKYVGHKRFSLQGGETLIPMLSVLADECGGHGIREIVLGMSHRGRLNVLRNVLGKPLADIFSEFEDQNIYTALGSGDVKYHLGFATRYTDSEGREVRLTLAPNPSHLEFVGPVVQGMARARQDQLYARNRKSVLPVLLHGDAAFIGQGIVTEMFNFAGAEGYHTGGSVHIVINNQVGFTTSPDEARSSPYCTDFAKAVLCPVFHVNCEDVEGACWATRLALEFCARYKRDVVLDLVCYRKYGHNEGDDPSFTQPTMYKEIQEKSPISAVYGKRLSEHGIVSDETVEREFSDFYERFSNAQHGLKESRLIGEGCPMHGRLRGEEPHTAVPAERLQKIAATLINYPSDFTVHPKLHKILEKRVASLTEGSGIDWGFAEGLAYGSLIGDGISVRLSGQDCGRGTFSQRHLVLNNYENGDHYVPFSQLMNAESGSFEVFNSTLSEAAVMGFEFGYAAEGQNALTLWEAQFGDFANGAQVIIDQFLSSSEQKWDQLSGLVLLLPHGFEGQGPEHSSARLERFLQLCADNNMTVCYPTAAQQCFHLLRRQGLLQIKRPLIVMTPKSLLRLPAAACSTADLTDGRFSTVLCDDFGNADAIESIVLTSGKVFYDIAAILGEQKRGVRVLRLEQLYPFPAERISRLIQETEASRCFWVQEEPKNMGAWHFIDAELRECFDLTAKYIGRPESASPATGSSKRHALEQQKIMADLLRGVAEDI